MVGMSDRSPRSVQVAINHHPHLVTDSAPTFGASLNWIRVKRQYDDEEQPCHRRRVSHPEVHHCVLEEI